MIILFWIFFCKFAVFKIQIKMSLIKSISGIRGTIGGKPGDSLSPLDIVRFTAAFGTWISKKRGAGGRIKIVVGRDARISGGLVNQIVVGTFRSLGIDVIDIGLATTPTVEIAVTGTAADGGVIITASHNPYNWNALKLLNEQGEFISGEDGDEVLELADSEHFEFADVKSLGSLIHDNTWGKKHIDRIMMLDQVRTANIRASLFTVVIDTINSVGGIILPDLLRELGVTRIITLNSRPDGHFAHNPEPLPENLSDLSEAVKREKADVGFAVDPDVDRLAIVCEDGSMFGEEYSLVSIADYILKKTPGNTVSNMSSSKALKDITEKHGCRYFSSPVGEIKVVEEMKKRKAVIGGEGNGGIIYPVLHYGRDSLAGMALFLSHLATSKMKCSELRSLYPDYFIAKKKLTLNPEDDILRILGKIKEHFKGYKIDERDGMKIEHPSGWVHLRKSNTEPIMRIYAEGRTETEANEFADEVIGIVKKL
jgi:phosphomannomutase